MDMGQGNGQVLQKTCNVPQRTEEALKRKVTVLVVTYNAQKLLGELAETLNCLEPNCSVVISDNGSSDGTPETIRRLVPGAEVIENPVNGGFGYGNNRGLERVETPFVLFLNSDAKIDVEGVQKLV
ncbi:MAG: glycosyltransferase, partial [Candidatus Aegiribacteria sp.]|nr:glycosyltransferase [Candidatus Aegiribacteria sp.]MBD3295067.1 glycosyltransferase [Candidatus Fermentibacteria bacterium]